MQPEKSFSKMCVCVCVRRRCWRKQWRGHPADHNHHQPWWTLWDLQVGREGRTGIDFTLRDPTHTFYYLLLHWHPTYPLVIQQSFPWWPTQPKTQHHHLHCMCSAGTTSAVPLLQHQTISCVLNVPPSSHIFLKAEYYQCSYQSFSFHGEFSLTF